MKELEISGLRKIVPVKRSEEEEKVFEIEFEKFVKEMDIFRADSILKSIKSRIEASKVIIL
jgi:hypothetical protein